MAQTNLRYNIRPYLGGEAFSDGSVTAKVIVPTTVFLAKKESGQVTPAAEGYTLSLVSGAMYEHNAPEALVGSYYWHAEDADDNFLADGFIDIRADDAGPYYAHWQASARVAFLEKLDVSGALALQDTLLAVKSRTDQIGSQGGASGVDLISGDKRTYVGETRSVTLSVDDDPTAKTLRVVWQRLRRSEDLAVVEDADISRTTDSVSFAVPSAVAARPQTLDYTLLDITSGVNQVIKSGKWQVLSAAQKDA